MADNTKKPDTGKASAMDDTRTRKTLKLKPIKDVAKSGSPGIVDPLTARNTDTGPLDTLDDTRTRKTVKLSSTQKTEGLRPVVDPLTTRDAETGPLGAMKDTRTRKTVKLKPMTKGEGAKEGSEGKAEGTENHTDTSTRKTLKLKPINPAEKKPPIKLGESGAKGFKDTNTRKTLKLKPVAPESASTEAAPAASEQDFDDTRTRKTVTTPIKKSTPPSAPEQEAEPEVTVSEDDTIKIQRPAPKPDAMPMPALGAPAAAKKVNSKDTVKLVAPSANGSSAAAAGENANAKATVKLTPPSVKAPEAKKAPEEDKKPEAEKPKSKLTIGKPPPPKTAPPQEEEAEAPPVAGGGLKLKSMAPKTEAPRAQADQEKIKEIKSGKKGGGDASSVYTLVAAIAVVLIAFSALVTAAQYFNLWNQKLIGGNPIELPVMKDLVK